MNEPKIIQQQLNREDQQIKTVFKKCQKDLKEQNYKQIPSRSGLNPRRKVDFSPHQFIAIEICSGNTSLI